LLKRWVEERPSRVKRILDRIENHLSHRKRVPHEEHKRRKKREVKKP